MTFRNVSDVTKPRHIVIFSGKIFDLPEFLSHYNTNFNRNALQTDDST